MNVKVEEIPELTVAYIRHIGPYKGDSDLFSELFQKLFKWAGPRDLLQQKEMLVMSIYHDDPGVTDEGKLRMSIAISIPAGTEGSGEVGTMKLERGRYAKARFEILPHQYENAWKQVYGEWLPESGYVPDRGPTLELYLNDPKTHPGGKHIVDICVPVKPA